MRAAGWREKASKARPPQTSRVAPQVSFYCSRAREWRKVGGGCHGGLPMSPSPIGGQTQTADPRKQPSALCPVILSATLLSPRHSKWSHVLPFCGPHSCPRIPFPVRTHTGHAIQSSLTVAPLPSVKHQVGQVLTPLPLFCLSSLLFQSHPSSHAL